MDKRKIMKITLRVVGVLLVVAGPLGWATAEQIAAIQALITALGTDPGETAVGVSGLGSAILLADFVSSKKSVEKSK